MVGKRGITRIPGRDERHRCVDLDDVGVGDAAIEGPCRVEHDVSVHSGSVNHARVAAVHF